MVKPARRHEYPVARGRLALDEGHGGGFGPRHEITAEDMKDVQGVAFARKYFEGTKMFLPSYKNVRIAFDSTKKRTPKGPERPNWPDFEWHFPCF